MAGSSANVAQEVLKKKHNEVDELLALLDSRLNALTNFHFTPKV